MKVNKFLELVEVVLDDLGNEEHKEAFVKNMEHIAKTRGGYSDKKFSEWLMTYFAWSEVASEEDIALYYWNLEEEDDNARL